jgi:hypothetical protein
VHLSPRIPVRDNEYGGLKENGSPEETGIEQESNSLFHSYKLEVFICFIATQ